MFSGFPGLLPGNPLNFFRHPLTKHINGFWCYSLKLHLPIPLHLTWPTACIFHL
jgi:hypothetical protein